jgi:NitT/TauT family transport system ATP-binding protein
MSRIAFDQVSRIYQRRDRAVAAVEHVSFAVAEQEFVAVVGPSGCGKTTLLRLAAGLDVPTAGRVLVGDRPVDGPGPERAVVFQQFALFPWKTVRDNIGFGLKCRGVPARERDVRTGHFVSLMGLEGHENAYPHQLSGGMQQRVAIARSYIMAPDVLLMDEPFGALDAQTRVTMQEELTRVARANPRTVLFITHSVEEAVLLADRVVVMTPRPGRVGEILDVAPARVRGGWADAPVEDVRHDPAFTELAAHIWKLLRHPPP